MFVFIRNLFAKKESIPQPQVFKAEAAAVAKKADSPIFLNKHRNIHFKRGLTDKFKDDHQELLGLYSAIMTSAQEKNCTEVKVNLSMFKQKITDHLAEEFRDLYVFIEYFAEGHDSDDKRRIHDFRNEMNVIGGSIMGVLNKYESRELNEDALPQLIEDFGALGDILVERIEREEHDLYRIYDNYGIRFAKAA